MQLCKVHWTLTLTALVATCLVIVVVRNPDSGWAKAAPLCAAILVFAAAEVLRQRVEYVKVLTDLRREVRDAYVDVHVGMVEGDHEETPKRLASGAAKATLALAICNQARVCDVAPLLRWIEAVSGTAGALRRDPQDCRTAEVLNLRLRVLQDQMRESGVSDWLTNLFRE